MKQEREEIPSVLINHALIQQNAERVMTRNLFKDLPANSLQEDGAEKKITVPEDMFQRGDLIASPKVWKTRTTMSGVETEGTSRWQEEVEIQMSTKIQVKDQQELPHTAKVQETENMPEEPDMLLQEIPSKKSKERMIMIENRILHLQTRREGENNQNPRP